MKQAVCVKQGGISEQYHGDTHRSRIDTYAVAEERDYSPYSLTYLIEKFLIYYIEKVQILQPLSSKRIFLLFSELFSKKGLTFHKRFVIIVPVPSNIWGYSSAGRALEWHSRGQRFDPAYLHQGPEIQVISGLFLFSWINLDRLIFGCNSPLRKV